MKKTHTDYSVLHRRIKTFPVCRRIKSYKSLVETIPSLLSNPGSNEEAFRMVTPTYVAGVAGCCLHSERGKSETYRCGIILFWLRGLHGVPVSNMEVLLFNGILMGRCLPRYSYYCAISRANAFRDWGRIKIRPLLKSPLRIIQRNLASFSYLFFHRFSPFFLFFFPSSLKYLLLLPPSFFSKVFGKLNFLSTAIS